MTSSSPHPPVHHRRTQRGCAARGAALAAAALAMACAGAPKKPDLFWPDPPEKTRIKLVRTIQGEADLRTSFWNRLVRALFDTSSSMVTYPTGMAIDPSERFLYVTGPTRVVRIDLQEGRVRDAVSRKPRAPYGVAVDAEGRLYVSDHAGNEVSVYDPGGQLVAKIGRGMLQQPTGIAIDRRAQILYVVSGAGRESKRHVIEAFSLKGDHLRTIGTRGSNPGEFNFPVNIAVGAEGRIFVTDMLNFRVQALEREGQPYGMFGQAGVGAPAHFQKLKGIALDSFGNIHVSDSHSGNVQVFNARFQPLIAYGGAAVPMVVPTAVAIDSKNNIFVADYGNHAVHQFALVGTTAEDCLPKQGEKAKAPPAPAATGDAGPAQPAPPASGDASRAQPAGGGQAEAEPP